MDLGQIDAELVFENAVDEDRRRHRVERHADALTGEVLRALDSRFAINRDEAKPKCDRWEHRDSHERAIAVGEALDEFGTGIFGDIELLSARHSIEDRPRLIDGDEVEIDAVRFHLAGIKRKHPVIERAGKRKLQLGHRCAVLPLRYVFRSSTQLKKPRVQK